MRPRAASVEPFQVWGMHAPHRGMHQGEMERVMTGLAFYGLVWLMNPEKNVCNQVRYVVPVTDPSIFPTRTSLFGRDWTIVHLTGRLQSTIWKRVESPKASELSRVGMVKF